MKMVMALVPRDQADLVLEGLVAAGHTATFCESRGGVLRQAQKMLFIAAPEPRLEQVLSIIRTCSKNEVQIESGEARDFSLTETPQAAEVGWALVFVWDIERIETY